MITYILIYHYKGKCSIGWMVCVCPRPHVDRNILLVFFVLFFCHPPASSSLSIIRHQPTCRLTRWRLTCFLHDRWNQLPSSFWTAAHGDSQGSRTLWGKCYLPFSPIRAHRCMRLVSVGLIDRKERICSSSHPEDTASFAPLASVHRCLWHHQDLNLSDRIWWSWPCVYI